MGTFVKDVPKENITKRDWIPAVSTNGYLTVASDNLYKAATILEDEFHKFHPISDLLRDRFIFTNLTNILSNILVKKKIYIPTEVLASLVRHRTYIRLKNIQERHKNTIKLKPKGKVDTKKVIEDTKKKRKELKKTLKHVVHIKKV